LRTESAIDKLLIRDGKITGVELLSKEIIETDKLIIAAGGLSYPATGSTATGSSWQKRRDIRL